MSSRVGRPKVIPPNVKKLITIRAWQNRTIDRGTLAEQLDSEIEKMNEIPPSIETMKKMISEARSHSLGELDNGFTLGAIADLRKEGIFDFSEDAIKRIWKIQKWLESDDKAPQGVKLITIRQAIWIDKLKGLVEGDEDLFHASFVYSFQELLDSVAQSTLIQWIWIKRCEIKLLILKLGFYIRR